MYIATKLVAIGTIIGAIGYVGSKFIGTTYIIMLICGFIMIFGAILGIMAGLIE
jgi:hypothetical protein